MASGGAQRALQPPLLHPTHRPLTAARLRHRQLQHRAQRLNKVVALAAVVETAVGPTKARPIWTKSGVISIVNSAASLAATNPIQAATSQTGIATTEVAAMAAAEISNLI